MYQAIGMNTGKVYAQGSRAECFRSLGESHPYIISEKSRSGWGRGNIITDKPIYNEPIKIVKMGGVLLKL